MVGSAGAAVEIGGLLEPHRHPVTELVEQSQIGAARPVAQIAGSLVERHCVTRGWLTPPTLLDHAAEQGAATAVVEIARGLESLAGPGQVEGHATAPLVHEARVGTANTVVQGTGLVVEGGGARLVLLGAEALLEHPPEVGAAVAIVEIARPSEALDGHGVVSRDAVALSVREPCPVAGGPESHLAGALLQVGGLASLAAQAEPVTAGGVLQVAAAVEQCRAGRFVGRDAGAGEGGEALKRAPSRLLELARVAVCAEGPSRLGRASEAVLEHDAVLNATVARIPLAGALERAARGERIRGNLTDAVLQEVAQKGAAVGAAAVAALLVALHGPQVVLLDADAALVEQPGERASLGDPAHAALREPAPRLVVVGVDVVAPHEQDPVIAARFGVTVVAGLAEQGGGPRLVQVDAEAALIGHPELPALARLAPVAVCGPSTRLLLGGEVGIDEVARDGCGRGLVLGGRRLVASLGEVLQPARLGELGDLHRRRFAAGLHRLHVLQRSSHVCSAALASSGDAWRASRTVCHWLDAWAWTRRFSRAISASQASPLRSTNWPSSWNEEANCPCVGVWLELADTSLRTWGNKVSGVT